MQTKSLGSISVMYDIACVLEKSLKVSIGIFKMDFFHKLHLMLALDQG